MVARQGEISDVSNTSMNITVTGQDADGQGSTWTNTRWIGMSSGGIINIDNGGTVIAGANTDKTYAIRVLGSGIINMKGAGAIDARHNILFGGTASLNISGLSNDISITSGHNLSFASNSTFTMTLHDGDANASAPMLAINGDWALGSKGLDVLLAGGYSPKIGDVFHLLSFAPGSLTGTLDTTTVDLPTLDGTLSWDTSNLATGTLRVVPEPASFTMILCSGVLLLRRRRNERRA